MSELISHVDRWQRERTWLSFPIGLGKRYGEHQGGRLAAAIAYFAFFSLFPLLLVFVSVLDLVLESRPEVRDDLLDSALGRLPLVGSQISAPPSAVDGSLLPVVVGLLVSLWAGLGAMSSLNGALATVWDVRPGERPNFLVSRLIGLAALLGVALLLAASTLVGNLSQLLGGGWVVSAVGLVVNLATDVVGLLVVFTLLTPSSHRWRVHVPGAVVGGIAVFALQQGGGLIARRYADSSDTYGTIAFVIGLLAWLHLVSLVVVLSAEINAVVANRLHPRSLDPDVVTDADRRAMLLNTERVLHDEQLSPVVSVPAGAEP